MTDPPAISSATPDFSGLAAIPPAPPQPVVTAPTPPLDSAASPLLLVSPVAAAPLPNISPESIGTQKTQGLGAGMWKGTARPLAEHLVSLAALTSSPALNDLVRRLLTTAAAPPDGVSESKQSLTSMRVEKLAALGDGAEAWDLASHADAKLIDDVTFHFAAENALALDSASLCGQIPVFVKARSTVDWQKILTLCQLRDKDSKAAQVSLDVLRAQNNRDDMFLEVADKNVLSDGKILPRQLTPLTPSMLALLRLANLPLPGELYGHPDFALVPALLHAPAKQDVAQLGLAERALERGVIDGAALAMLYRSITFTPDELANPLAASESGSRLRALLVQVAGAEKDAARRINYAVKFVQSATPALLNGTDNLLADMLGSVKTDTAPLDNAATVTQIYMLAGKNEAALEWIKPARKNLADWQILWPQFVLAGLESENDFTTDLTTWLDTTLKPSDPQADMRRTQESAATLLLLLDTNGFTVPDDAWGKVLSAPHNEKKIALSPLFLERMQAAAMGNRRAETILLAVDLAGDSDIPLPATLAIIRALRTIGLKSEAAIFAREQAALLGKTS